MKTKKKRKEIQGISLAKPQQQIEKADNNSSKDKILILGKNSKTLQMKYHNENSGKKGKIQYNDS